jgi:hypothetical protein
MTLPVVHYGSRAYQATASFEGWQRGFATTQSITVESADEVSRAPEAVAVTVVAVDLVNGRRVSRRFTGTWGLVGEDGVWKLDAAQINVEP